MDQVHSQVLAEGGSEIEAEAASTKLQSAWNDMVNNGVVQDASRALQAATQYAQLAYAPSGAIAQVGNLVSAAAAGAPTPQLVSSFGGTLVAAAAVAGGASAGVGAAIVAAVAIAQAGLTALFSSPPPQASLCGVDYQNWKPSIIINCVGSNARSVAPGSSDWRHFPSRASLEDTRVWYTPCTQQNNNCDGPWGTTQRDDGQPATWAGPSYPIAVLAYNAWPQLYHLECELDAYVMGRNGLQDFFLAFIQAWKANQEYALNGLNSAADWQVLIHAVNLWNRAHDGSQSVEMEPRARSFLLRPGDPCPALGANPSPPVPYVSILINDVIANSPGDAPGGKLHVNTGALRILPGQSSSSSGVSTTAKVVGGLTLAAVAAPAIWALLQRRAVGAVYGRAWKAIEDGVKRTWRAVT